jgi:hypothetical protein
LLYFLLFYRLDFVFFLSTLQRYGFSLCQKTNYLIFSKLLSDTPPPDATKSGEGSKNCRKTHKKNKKTIKSGNGKPLSEKTGWHQVPAGFN